MDDRPAGRSDQQSGHEPGADRPGPGPATVPRDDVAAAMVAMLDEPRTICQTLYVNGGPEPITQALAAALA
jgi:hypothetical protein